MDFSRERKVVKDEILKELAKWNPTVVAPSCATNTCASNINLKVGAAPVLKGSRELQQEMFP